MTREVGVFKKPEARGVPAAGKSGVAACDCSRLIDVEFDSSYVVNCAGGPGSRHGRSARRILEKIKGAVLGTG